MLGLGEAKPRDSLQLLPLYMHRFSQLGWGLHMSYYVRSWVIWSPRWAVPIGLLSNWICCFLLEAAWSREGHQISISSGPQAELTIRGPCWVGLRHYCQL